MNDVIDILEAMRQEIEKSFDSFAVSAEPVETLRDHSRFVIELPRRTHRRSRIRKKWLSRYGTRLVHIQMRVMLFGPPTT
jgi:hypothetical protein